MKHERSDFNGGCCCTAETLRLETQGPEQESHHLRCMVGLSKPEDTLEQFSPCSPRPAAWWSASKA